MQKVTEKRRTIGSTRGYLVTKLQLGNATLRSSASRFHSSPERLLEILEDRLILF